MSENSEIIGISEFLFGDLISDGLRLELGENSLCLSNQVSGG